MEAGALKLTGIKQSMQIRQGRRRVAVTGLRLKQVEFPKVFVRNLN